MEKLLIFLHCVTAFKEKYDVKIQHKSSNETVLNEFSITLDKINNNIIKDIATHNIENSETTLNKKNVKNIKREHDYLKFTKKDNSAVFYNNIPFSTIKRNNEEIKHDLDKFVIQRKRSHLTTVEFNFNIPFTNREIRSYDKVKINLKDNIKRKRIKENDKERNSLVNSREIYKNRFNINEKGVDRIHYIRELGNNKISQEIRLNDMFKRPEIQEMLKKQNTLVDRLARLFKEGKKTLRMDFDTLLEEMENLKNETQKQEVIQNPIQPATVNIDETAVREALKKDPLVRRVLQMGQRKRDVYVKEANIFNNMLV